MNDHFANAEQNRAWMQGGTARRQAKIERMFAKGRLISAQLAEFAEQSRVRIADICEQYPDIEEQ